MANNETEIVKALKQRIRIEGKILPGDVLKVDGFLNHCMDVDFLADLGWEFFRLFDGTGVNKILTIESGGIGIACLTAQKFHCPAVFAKKAKSASNGRDRWTATVHSYLHDADREIYVTRDYLTKDDTVLIIDDILANGSALLALVSLCRKAGAKIAGVGVVAEKIYQDGGKLLRKAGVRVESLTKISAMDPQTGVAFAANGENI